MSGVIRWEEPTPFTMGPKTDKRIPWAVIAEQLKAHPGRWGVVYEGGGQVSYIAQRIIQGKTPWFRPAGTFEAAMRSIGTATVVYARYVGEASDG